MVVVLEQILDVIGCEPTVSDNELRNKFRGLGEMCVTDNPLTVTGAWLTSSDAINQFLYPAME